MIVNWPAVQEAMDSVRHAADYLSGDDPLTEENKQNALDCLEDAERALDEAMEEI